MIEEIKIDRLEELIHEMMIKIRDTYPTNSAEGNPIEFENGAAAPLVKCVTAISGYQEGSGAPSPDNVRTIHAYSASTIKVEGESEVTQQTCVASFSKAIYRGNADFVGKTATCNMILIDLGSLTWTYNSSGDVFVTNLSDWSSTNKDTAICEMFEVTLHAGAVAGLALAEDKHAYYQGSNTNLFIKYTDFETDADAFKTAMSGVHFAFLLATPTSETITPTNSPIKSLTGFNHIESSTGDMEVTYITEEFEPLVPTT